MFKGITHAQTHTHTYTHIQTHTHTHVPRDIFRTAKKNPICDETSGFIIKKHVGLPLKKLM